LDLSHLLDRLNGLLRLDNLRLDRLRLDLSHLFDRLNGLLRFDDLRLDRLRLNGDHLTDRSDRLNYGVDYLRALLRGHPCDKRVRLWLRRMNGLYGALLRRLDFGKRSGHFFVLNLVQGLD
jgi:hypothetical protein